MSPLEGPIVGVDLGERHVGLALWDDPELPARPLECVHGAGDGLLREVLNKLRRLGARRVVVGLPLRLDGREGQASRRARRIATWLEAKLGLPVVLQDERLTTSQAHTRRVLAGVKGREGIDAHAAAIVLQTYLDTQALARTERDLGDDS